jgi:hypothetical protein
MVEIGVAERSPGWVAKVIRASIPIRRSTGTDAKAKTTPRAIKISPSRQNPRQNREPVPPEFKLDPP